jgi:glutaminase
MKKGLPAEIFGGLEFFESTDLALEQCENRLIEKYGTRRPSIQRVDLADCELLAGLSGDEVRLVREVVQQQTFHAQDIIIREGDAPNAMYFLLLGKTSVWIQLAAGMEKRVATFSPGMTFGEMALLDRAPRSAAVRADQEVECASLSLDAFEKLSAGHAKIQTAIYRNLARILARRVRKSNLQISAMDQ